MKLSELVQTHPFSALASELLRDGQASQLGQCLDAAGLVLVCVQHPHKAPCLPCSLLASGRAALGTQGATWQQKAFIFLRLSVLSPFCQRLFAFTIFSSLFSMPVPGTVCPWQWFLPIWTCLLSSRVLICSWHKPTHCHSLFFCGFHTVFQFPCLFCLCRQGKWEVFFPCSVDEQLKEKSFACLEKELSKTTTVWKNECVEVNLKEKANKKKKYIN